MATDYTQRLQNWANLAKRLDCNIEFDDPSLDVAKLTPASGIGQTAVIPTWLLELLTRRSQVKPPKATPLKSVGTNG